MGLLIAQSPDEWAQVISESFVPLTLGSVAPSFRGSVRSYSLGAAVTLSEVRTFGASVVVRSPRLVRKEPCDDCLFSLHLDGEGVVVQGVRESALSRGGGALYDSSRPYELRFPTDTRQFVLQTSRDLLRDRIGPVEDLCAHALPAGHPTVRVLSAYTAELAASCGDMTDVQRAELGVTAVDLLTTALRAVNGRGSGLPGEGGGLLVAMQAYVREHLAEVLARRHHVSPRYTYSLFATAGTPPAAFIRAERLHAAYRALTNPRLAALPVSIIAARCGFTDRTTFTRSFVRAYGQTPSETRAFARPE
jgi:AraC-like DNA-binding protein